MTEEWREVPGTDGRYWVSSTGRLRRDYRTHSRLFSGCRTKHGYVTCSINSRHVFRHVLVARAFYGEPEPGQEVRHLNGTPGDDRVENLRWGTRSENAQDTLKHGRHNMASKTRCKHGHEFTEANTFIDNLGRRICRTCQRRHREREMQQVAARRRLARVERRRARPDREVRAVLTDGSELVAYRKPKPRYFREWPITDPRDREGISSLEFHSLLTDSRMENAA